MPYRRSIPLCPLSIAAATTALIAALGGSGVAPARVIAPVMPVQAAFAWPPAQVRALIAQIDLARRHGLDPGAYGLAALRAELDLCEQLWNTPGSRQLDTLAATAALALARDYRRRGGGGAGVTQAELDAALGAGRVGPWLAGMAPGGSAS